SAAPAAADGVYAVDSQIAAMDMLSRPVLYHCVETLCSAVASPDISFVHDAAMSTRFASDHILALPWNHQRGPTGATGVSRWDATSGWVPVSPMHRQVMWGRVHTGARQRARRGADREHR